MATAIRIAILANAAKARREMEETGRSASKMGDKVKGAFGGLAGIAKAGALSAGVAAAGALVKGFTGFLEQDALLSKSAARLGSFEEAQKAGEIAGRLYSKAYGENLGEVQSAVESVYANIGKGTAEATEEITAQVLSVSEAFDQDLGGVTAAVGQLMKTGLAKDAKDALDIITVGFQQGADKAGDLLDTFNEYGTQFRKLGIDGKTATGLLAQGLKAGARDADVVADSIKEFSIRAIDGSKSTVQGFQAIGLNARTMARDIASGGPKANAALDLTLDRLRAIKDPVKQSAVAVQLFGTQAEDLGAALFALDPSAAAKGLGDISQAAEKADEALGSSLQARLTSLKRTFEQGLTKGVETFFLAFSGASEVGQFTGVLEGVNRVGIQAGEAFKTVSKFVKEFFGALKKGGGGGGFTKLFDGIKTFAETVLPGFKKNLEGLVSTVVPKFQEIWNVIQTNVLPALSEFLVALGPFIAFFQERLGPVVQSVWGTILDVIKGALKVIGGILKVFTGILTGDWDKTWEGVKQIFAGVWDAIKGILGGALGILKAQLSGAWNAVLALTRAAWDGLKRKISETVSSVLTTVRALPGKIQAAFSGAKTLLLDAGRNIIQGFIDAIQGKFEDVKRLLGKLTGLLPSWKGPASRDRKLLVKNGQLVLGGFVAGLQSKYGDVRKSLARFTKGIARKQDVKVVTNAFANGIKKLNAQIAKQKKAVSDLVKARSDYSRQLATNLKDGGITTVDLVYQEPSFQKNALVDGLKARLQAVRDFQSKLKALRKKGLSVDIIRQIADSGLETGSQYLAALSGAAPALIKQINGLNGAINSAANETGSFVAGQIFDPRIQAAQKKLPPQEVILRLESGGSKLDEALLASLRKSIRSNGGNVQVVLGRG